MTMLDTLDDPKRVRGQENSLHAPLEAIFYVAGLALMTVTIVVVATIVVGIFSILIYLLS
jgi:hypothetical protein